MSCTILTGCRDTLPHMQRLAVYTGDALAERAVRAAPQNADASVALAQLRERLGRGDARATWCAAKELGHAAAAGRCL